MRLDNQYLVPPDIAKIVDDTRTFGNIESDHYVNLLTGINRKVDRMLMCVYFGIYYSKKLPPQQISSNLKYDGFIFQRFNANIDDDVNTIRNLFFLMWLQDGNLKFENKIDLREKLYSFLKIILDDRYFIETVVPFYLNIANQPMDDGVSFIRKMLNSSFIDHKESVYSPETIAIEFLSYKEEFFDEFGMNIDENFLKQKFY